MAERRVPVTVGSSELMEKFTPSATNLMMGAGEVPAFLVDGLVLQDPVAVADSLQCTYGTNDANAKF